MKVVFMGTPQAAVPSFERLIEDGHEIAAVYTQPDRPSGRGNKVTFSPVKQFALEHGIPVFQPLKIKTPEELEVFRSHEADAAVVVAYGRILPPGFLNAFHFGAVNVHFSLLPKYRGAAPVNWAIVNGESVTGVTTMQMDEGLDTGDILLQKEYAIRDSESASELMARLADAGAGLLSETLSTFDSIEPRKQDESQASLAPMLKKTDGVIDWSLPADAIERRVRGFQPFPTAFTFYSGKRLTIWSAVVEMADSSDRRPVGTLFIGEGRIMVECGGGSRLAINELQFEGKKRMPVKEFLNGSPLRDGAVLGMKTDT
ncbi:MAG: methionyl-tRNA formyltransferase [Chloracidobacterium sp.]|nr:methionyl-tRNA formyltransferase [Chloracidobacterium sp.]